MVKRRFHWVFNILLISLLMISIDTFALSSGVNVGSNGSTTESNSLPVSYIQEISESQLISASQSQDKLEGWATQYFDFWPLEDWISRLIFAAITTLILIGALWLNNFAFRRIILRINNIRQTQTLALNIQSFQVLSSEALANGLLTITQIVRLGLNILIVIIYLTILPNFFPQTESIGQRILNFVLNILSDFGQGIISYVPNLFAIILVAVFTRYLLRFLGLFFKAVEEEKLKIPGFYKEWIEPTHKLAKALICALSLTFIFPYLPGFGSPAFQGISILLGALITLGGAGTVSNLIGGFITIYTRAFQMGDRIRIGDYVGYVMEKTILSTRIRTSNNEIITIPNSSLLASTIVNYTATLRDLDRPLFLETTISLKYDVPSSKVHEVLIEAAKSTSYVLEDPQPIVEQRNLNEFYVTYALRVCTCEINRFSSIKSELNQIILEKCNANGIELLSPHYSALRPPASNA